MSGFSRTRRTIEERWERAGFNVAHERRVRLSDDGRTPVVAPDGTPQTIELAVLELFSFDEAGNVERTLRVPLDATSKAKLAQALTGGIVLARPIGAGRG